jgi:hypothetical protein
MNMRFVLILSFFLSVVCTAQTKIESPHLVGSGSSTKLIVNNKPFIILGGELGNSSASSTEYLAPMWSKFTKMNLNTVIAPVYWELMEPSEGKFDFTLVDELIDSARKHHLKLVLLWFGTWKNSMSCYVPAWMKTNEERFPRTQNSNGKTEEIITPFSKNALEADKKAFVQLIQHIKQKDSKEQTVLMIQVENEIGMLPEARDYSPAANAAFQQTVPGKLIQYLNTNKEQLLPEIKERWQQNGTKTSGSWEEVFGKSLATDEIFMAWYFGQFVEEIAHAGKQVYNIPMYVNAALNRPGRKPGEYPSAGPLPHVTDIWKAAAPSIDFLSPDFYNPDFKHWNDLYTRAGNPLFIPEHRFENGVEAKAFYAIGHYHALGFSPFSIESTAKPEQEPLGKAYDIIQQLSNVINSRSAKSMDGVLLSKQDDTIKITMGDYEMTIVHDNKLGWTPQSKDSTWPLTGAIIISISNDEFYVGGTGIVITFKPVASNLQAGILLIDEGKFVSGKWTPGRRMNGDQDHQGRHLRIPLNEYGIQRVKLYSYK